MIFGEKTVAWFDVWSLEHFVAGMSAAALILWFMRKKGYDEKDSLLFYGLLLCITFAWEMLEHYLEAGVTGNEWLTYWFQGVEFWGNRLITDPLLVVAGSMVALRYKKLFLPARLFSIAWLVVHVFIFPHSMYLHRFLE